MMYKYKKLKDFKLSKGIINVYQDMIKKHPAATETMWFDLNIIKDKDGLCLNVLVKYKPNPYAGEYTYKNYRIGKAGNIKTWIEDLTEADEETEENEKDKEDKRKEKKEEKEEKEDGEK